jgi:hypothetical protein
MAIAEPETDTKMKKIETLTDEQKAKFQEYIKKWTDIGLSTEPANRI